MAVVVVMGGQCAGQPLARGWRGSALVKAARWFTDAPSWLPCPSPAVDSDCLADPAAYPDRELYSDCQPHLQPKPVRDRLPQRLPDGLRHPIWHQDLEWDCHGILHSFAQPHRLSVADIHLHWVSEPDQGCPWEASATAACRPSAGWQAEMVAGW